MWVKRDERHVTEAERTHLPHVLTFKGAAGHLESAVSLEKKGLW